MQKIIKLPKKLLDPKYSKIYFFIAIFAIIGAFLVFSSSAATPYTSSDITAVKTLGLYPGFGNPRGKANHEKWENLLGRRITFADANIDHSSWSAFGGSSWGNFEGNSTDMASFFRTRTDVTPAVTIPLRVDSQGARTNKLGGPELIRKELQDTANGLNDDKYRVIADRLVKFGQAKAILRIGHEADIEWYPHAFRNGNEDVYISAFRHVVDVFRSYPGNQFLIDYNGNGAFRLSYTSPRTGITQPYGDAGYPGDAYVDIIGIDTYNRGNGSWEGNKAYLDYTLNFAKKHGKPMSIPEWGLWASETGDQPTYIQNMYDWINSTPKTGPGRMVYHSYFQDHPEADLEKAPKSKAKFIELFSEKGSGISQPPPITTTVPDVIIVANSINYSPASPKSGDNVTFKATIRNIGTAPTPGGVIHGVSFRINGSAVSWSDNSTTSLAPGESREVTASGGPKGLSYWVAQEGRLDLTAVWDDVNRITESNEQNNNSISSITVAAGTLPVNPVPPAIATVSLISGSNVPVNTPTSVDVQINSNGIPLKTASVRVLYDATRLDFVSVDESGSKFTGGGIPTYSEPGLIEINRFEINGVTGNNLQFVKLNFTTKYTTGSTAVSVGPSFLYQDSNSNSFSQSGSTNAQINITKPVDITPPVSKINTYPSGLVSSSNIAISVVATDNVAISRVALEIVGGAEIASDDIFPYNLTVDTRTKTLLNGNYQLQAVSYDTSGNRTVSSPILVKIRLTDIDRSGIADIGDLTAIISSWNQSNPAIATAAANDLDDDGVIGIGDLTKLISAWGR